MESEHLKKTKWIKDAVNYAKITVGIVFGGRLWENEEKREWVENIKGRAWYLDGTPPKGFVFLNDGTEGIVPEGAICLDNEILTVEAVIGDIITEFVYPISPKETFKEWGHNFFKREDLDMSVLSVLNENPKKVKDAVSLVIDTIFSDIEENPKKKLSELREEWGIP